jgi:type II secretory pathway pseudopilin PulG
MTKRTRTIVALVVAAFVLTILAMIISPVLMSARLAATKAQGLSNFKQLSNAWLAYASDNNDKSCDTKNWNQDLAAYCKTPMEEVIRNPLVKDGADQRNVGLNSKVGFIDLSIQNLEKPLVVFATTSKPGANAWVSETTVAPFAPGYRQSLISSELGEARFVSPDQLGRFTWQPVRAKK